MLLKDFDINLIRPKSNRSMENILCVAILNDDIEEVLPYLNTEMHGLQFTKDPPALLLKEQGRIIVIRPQEIAINSVVDQSDAEATLRWLQERINDTWQRREEIEPSYDIMPRPEIIQILKLLERTNCSVCGEPSCVSFAVKLADRLKEPDDCPLLEEGRRVKLEEYLEQFA